MNDLEKLIESKKAYYKMPPKKMVKKGTIATGIVETTPFVWKDKLYYFEWHREYTDTTIKGCYRITDFESGRVACDFAENHSFGAVYVENDVVYAIGVRGNFGDCTLDLFISNDLVNWEQKTVFSDESFKIYNTSICKGANEYIMAVEIDKPVEIAGNNPYTIIFFKSADLINWTLLDTEKHIYVKDRYAACPAIRYADGYYYMIYLETFALYNCVPCIARSKDLSDWYLAPLNPIMFYDDYDRLIPYPERLSDDEKTIINNSLNTNNSDVDLCEYKDKTYIMYSWGNQLGGEFLAYAEYDGSMEEFLKSFF